MDDALGEAMRLAEQRGMTATLTVKYRSLTPVDADLRFESWVHDETDRKIVVRATCRAGGCSRRKPRRSSLP
jgi:hypothetical protein